MPIVEAVQEQFTTQSNGLDFGAGTGPVITKLLSERGYALALYDPFFHPEKVVLNTTYDYIVCCEVIEHFHDPLQEFKRLKNLLKPNGKIFCMTALWDDTVDRFKDWHYKNDMTHVLFYNESSLKWIAKKIGCTELTIEGRMIILS